MSPAAPGVFDAVVEAALASGVRVRFRAYGTSMHPAIRDGETIAVEPVDVADVVRGDILLYRSRERLLAHRVEAVAERRGVRTLQTRGDAMLGLDAPVGAAEVIGRVTAVVRGSRAVRLDGRAARLRYRVHALVAGTRRRIGSARVRFSGHATIPVE